MQEGKHVFNLPFRCPYLESTLLGPLQTKPHCPPGGTTCISWRDGVAQLWLPFQFSSGDLSPVSSLPFLTPQSHLTGDWYDIWVLPQDSFGQVTLPGHPESCPVLKAQVWSDSQSHSSSESSLFIVVQ